MFDGEIQEKTIDETQTVGDGLAVLDSLLDAELGYPEDEVLAVSEMHDEVGLHPDNIFFNLIRIQKEVTNERSRFPEVGNTTVSEKEEIVRSSETPTGSNFPMTLEPETQEDNQDVDPFVLTGNDSEVVPGAVPIARKLNGTTNITVQSEELKIAPKEKLPSPRNLTPQSSYTFGVPSTSKKPPPILTMMGTIPGLKTLISTKDSGSG
jgi:hypothetical protein